MTDNQQAGQGNSNPPAQTDPTPPTPPQDTGAGQQTGATPAPQTPATQTTASQTPPPQAPTSPTPPPPPPPAQDQQQMPQGGYMPPQQGNPYYGYQPQYQNQNPMDPYGYGGYPPQGGYMPPQYMPPQGMPPQGMPMGYPPQGMGYPPQGMQGMSPQGMMPQGGMQGPQGAQAQQEDMTPANFQLGTRLPRQLKVKCPPHGLKFDEEKFIKLLAGSISLSKDEKKKIVESVPKLKQEQIDELVRIFEEEKQKFAALSKKHVPQLEKLVDQHFNEWMELESEMEHEQRKKEDQQKADEIRKNLGI